MAKKATAEALDALGRKALERVVKPYDEHVTGNVFLAIEGDAALLKEYRELIALSSKKSVNTRLGRWVRDTTGRKTGPGMHSPKSSLIGYYSTLL